MLHLVPCMVIVWECTRWPVHRLCQGLIRSITVPRDIPWHYLFQWERYGLETELESYVQRQKAEKVVIHTVVIHRLKNEAQGLISLEPQIKFTFMGLGQGILSKAFLIAQLQLKLTKVNNYLYVPLKIRPYMKNGNKSLFLLFIYFVSKYHSKENKKLNQILPYIYFPRRAWKGKDKGCGGNEMQCFLAPIINCF